MNTPSSNGQAEQINPFVMLRAINRAPISSSQARLLSMIADRAMNSGICTASYATMAVDCNTDRRNAIKMVAALAKALLIVKEPTRNGNVIRLGPRLFELYRDQVLFEDARKQAKSKAAHPRATVNDKPVMPASPVQAKPVVMIQPPELVMIQPPPSDDPTTSASDDLTTQTSSSTTHRTSSSTSEAKSDDDDVRCASQGEKTQGTIDDVYDTIRRCKHLPNDLTAKIREDATLAHRIKGDWIGLASAVMHLDSKIRDGDAPTARKIQKPLAYLLTVYHELIDPEKTPPGLLAGLKDKVQTHKNRVPEPVARIYHGDCADEAEYRRTVRNFALSKLEADYPLSATRALIYDLIGQKADTLTAKEIEFRRRWANDELNRLEARA